MMLSSIPCGDFKLNISISAEHQPLRTLKRWSDALIGDFAEDRTRPLGNGELSLQQI